ncbi:hypothetical protein LINSTU_32 [Mycobacterium phage LinStu]|uniref:Uncharacterized protein n=1 Tax=Mycobacterium phage LinStu TaxID=1074307 RepID=G1JXC9_9CAUD|nr:hypothetical protein LINSTU_32 [Mycobacterium phage LinStu]AEL98470.1 hypothetical protein LINSTU_32 [Mycobacterium phage LinStu]
MSTPAQYRKKPVVVEALQWTGDNAEDLAEWATMPCHGAIPGSELICFMSMDDDEIFDTVESMRYDEFRAVGATAALWVKRQPELAADQGRGVGRQGPAGLLPGRGRRVRRDLRAGPVRNSGMNPHTAALY